MKNLYTLSNEDFNNLINIKFNNINDGFNNFNNGILQCFDDSLSFLEKEKKFISFFQDALLINSSYTIIDFYLRNLDSHEILNLLEALNYDNKVILLNELKNLKTDSVYFSLEDEELMDFITILNTRSLFFCTVYFKNIPFTIWGNYDLKFPIFFDNIETLNIYRNLANKHGLTINSITLKIKKVKY